LQEICLDDGAIVFAMSENVALEKIAPLTHEIRGERVILDSDLARIYGVSVKALNQAIKRNAERFPEDFAFQLNGAEWQRLRSQIVTSSSRSQIVTLKTHGGRRYSPYVFTEHGTIMAANVLNSEQAVDMSVFVVRAFVKLRETLIGHKGLSAKIDELDRKVGAHDKAIASIIAAIRQLTAPPTRKPRTIGFRAKRERGEDRAK
jgi:ORF6N domain